MSVHAIVNFSVSDSVNVHGSVGVNTLSVNECQCGCHSV